MLRRFSGKSWRCFAAVLLSALSSASWAQAAPRSYAVVSEVARQVSVVSYQPSVGKMGNNNRVQKIDVPDGALDKVFLLAAQKPLKAAPGVADVWLLAPAESDFFGLTMISDGGRLAIPADLKAALQERKSTHLLLFSRYRADADIRFDNMTESTGPLEGLGYYIDMEMPVRQVNKKEQVYGYLAAYTHFRATLIDVASERVVKSLVTRATRINTAAGNDAKEQHPWQALSAGEKMAQLRDLTQREVARMVPELLQP